MGGHYYPGKDKQRRHMRRKTLWYRLFCSSPWKRILSFFVLFYLLFWHGLVPVGEWLVQVGSYLSPAVKKGAKTNWLQYDSTLEVPLLRNEQLGRLQVASERARLQYGSPQRSKLRLDILEDIVPAWYHRNDDKHKKEPPKENLNEDQSKEKVTKNYEKEQDNKKQNSKEKGKRKPAAAEASTAAKNTTAADSLQQQQQIEKKLSEKQSAKDATIERKLQRTTSGDQFPFRTLQTMESYASNHTSCSSSLESNDLQTTLVIQTSISRLWILNETCGRWKDPIIAVIFVPFETPSPDIYIPCPHVQPILYLATKPESDTKAYPVNRLRNIGLDAVTTSHVLTVDIDFVPSRDLHQTIRTTLINQLGVQEDQRALVVPAFDRLPPEPCTTEAACASYLQASEDFLPHSFDDLQACVTAKECEPFQSRVSLGSHSSTQSEEWIQRNWFTGEEHTLLRAVDCFQSARYEPYVVLRWCPSSSDKIVTPEAPYYDERFHGYGKNKIELIAHLRKRGYRFSILPEGFLVHNPHPESTIKEEWNDQEGSDLHSSMDKLYIDFMKELEEKYKEVHGSTIKLCKRPK
jgi:flagellar biosynthesis GTPase FlhF